jgi:hypothetical protein
LLQARLSPARDNCVAGPVDAAAAPKNAYWSADTMVRVALRGFRIRSRSLALGI